MSSIRTAEHFSRQAGAYAHSPAHAAGEDLDWVEAFAEPHLDDLCLDIATGPGHTAFRLAPKVRCVLGLDLAQGMVEQAQLLAQERGIPQAIFLVGDAQALCFAPKTFHLVTCRIAPHHFSDVALAMREVARVLKEGGRFVLEDSLAPEDPAQALFLARLEVLRDPTHIQSLSLNAWNTVLEQAGLKITRQTVCRKVRSFERWVHLAGLCTEQTQELVTQILAAPPRVRDRFFGVEGTQVHTFFDEKLICRAERVG
ncbi:class I SAM-dependent methyltransferase [Anthocerotibacter panamensis]|uniref:class I SAM-dependent methyltransferase n=1 Tax=Anthocerotibacter panamensis TaxID=2857077 RepID=UPI001C40884E|nr:class I SAM-dependent methyltransferase [Anthocerotibacter panamensis]